ncbi:GMP synthase [glutamine-hydrolyzing] [Pseudovibrio axinellae]|uniref:GMP synthase [glutamine-hydrolyzing] n=1 Tax=Pseudovibrio axinellae TaxID=989403 RepID=A0A166A752_9HYPH|nr:glutamine amidotransferase [Pseudovibrio axinellae]KZL20686.1 GMP synthase [glutamine-hydrolyzing] [Pseudovibrio axinellae]SER25698.1 GMP synthase (glutamine-hydrolysing) [Pseudovibrio axinellae]
MLERNTQHKPKMLVVLHQENSNPGRVGQQLVKRGFELDIRRPRFGDALPHTLADHAGSVIFGGPMSANDRDDFVKQEIDWISVPLKENKPFLGICLGAQMLSKNLGGHVTGRDDGLVEIGYYPLQPTQKGTSLMDWPKQVYQWHREGFSLPSGSELLASSPTYENQAIRVGKNAFGIQFHPELTYAMMNRWTTRAASRLVLPGARKRGEHFRERFVHDPSVLHWLETFMDQWIGYASEPAGNWSSNICR